MRKEIFHFYLLFSLVVLIVQNHNIYAQCSHQKHMPSLNDFVSTVNDVSIVIEGEIISAEGFLIGDHIYTSHKFLVYKVLKGSVDTDTLELIRAGGLYKYPDGRIAMQGIPEHPAYHINQKGLFKLTKNRPIEYKENNHFRSTINIQHRYYISHESVNNYIHYGNIVSVNNKLSSKYNLFDEDDFVEKIYRPIEKLTGQQAKVFHELNYKYYKKNK